MRYPLDQVIVNEHGGFGVVAVAGTGLPDSSGVNKHVGTDLRARTPKPVRAPGSGVITRAQVGSTGNKILEVRIGDKDHRFLHLSKFVRQSGNVKEGELIAYTGATGGVAPHLHWDVRRAGTTWNQSFSNYVDPMSIINEGEQVETFKDANDVRVNGWGLYGYDQPGSINGQPNPALTVWVGQPKLDFFKGLGPQVANDTAVYKKRISELESGSGSNFVPVGELYIRKG